jgi:hypothetical protein
MNKNTNGYVIGFLAISIYTLLDDNVEGLVSFFATLIGVLLIPLILSGLIFLFDRSINFGKIFGITSIIIVTISFIGQYTSKNDTVDNIDKVVATDSIDYIINEHKASYAEFDKKLRVGNRKEILNQLISKNEIVLNKDTQAVLKKIEDAEDYFELMKKGNDSLLKKTIKRLEEYKNNNTIEKEKLRSLEMNLMQLNMLNNSLFMYYLNVTQLTSKIKNLILIKNKCKHEFQNNSIIFEDQVCLDEYNQVLSKIQELIIETNKSQKEFTKF